MPYKPSILDAWLAGKCGPGAADDLAGSVRREQLRRLRGQLDYARSRSRFYRHHLPDIRGENFSWPDLQNLPFTRESDLVDWKNFLCVSQSAVERVVTLESSGTLGAPKSLAFTLADLAATRDFFQAGMAQLAGRGDRVLTLWPGAKRPHGVSALLREALEGEGINVFAGEPLADQDSLRRELEAHDPHVIVAAPRQLAPLAELLSGERLGGGRRPALRGVLSSAESLPPELARALRERHGLLALDHYGLTETGYGGGVECPAHDGYHWREMDIFVEIVDPESGRPLGDGQEGEIVLTTLTREAMPLIRYRTGDVASLRPGPCRCGSPLRRLSPIKGRLTRRGGLWRIEKIAKGSFGERTAHASL